MKILIELPSWLGDAVMTTPAIENITNFYQESEIVLVGSLVSIEALKNHPRVTKVLILDKNYIKLYKAAKCIGNFDLFVSFRSSFRSKFFKLFISSTKKYQFNKNKFIDGHQVEKYNNFVNKALKIDSIPGPLKIERPRKLKKTNYRLLGVNPGASYGSSKRWYPDKFADVIADLSDSYDTIIFGGPNEKKIASDIEQLLNDKGITNFQNLSNKTTITELIETIQKLDLFITGDSGPMHLAAALNIPTVAIFGPTNHAKTSQWKNDKNVIVKKNLKCQPCMKRICPLQHHECMNLIEPFEVLDAIKKLN